MADHPIIFNAPMVRAILAGRKTITRRVLKPQPPAYTPGIIDITKPHRIDEHDLNGDEQTEDGARLGDWGQTETIWDMFALGGRGEPRSEIWRPLKGIRWRLGDHLWVRETWARNTDMPAGTPYGAVYKADPGHDYDVLKWTPCIYMPRWASRLTLLVTDVRVERLQDISEEDAAAEGHEPCRSCGDCGWVNSGPDGGWQCRDPGCGERHVDWFRRLWNTINGPASWDANPWVSVTTFERVTP